MAITPADIQAQTFSEAKRGYDPGEVEDVYQRQRLRSARAGSRFPRTHRSTSAPMWETIRLRWPRTAGAPSPP